MTRRLCFLIAVAAVAGTPAAAAATPVVPVVTQQRIAATVPAVAYMPARLAIGWHYEQWTHQQGVLRIFFANKAGYEITFVAAPFKGNCARPKEKTFQLAGVKVWWSHTHNEQQAWRCVNGVKLAAATGLGPDRFADVGLGRIVASGHRIR